MANHNGKTNSNPNMAKNNSLGPVTREKCQAILEARVRKCIAIQEAKIKARRADALQTLLERHELMSKLATYRAALENLIAFSPALHRTQ